MVGSGRVSRDPRPPQDVSAEDLVSHRVEPTSGIGLGRPVKRMLQGTNRVQHGPRRGGTSRNGTHRAPPSSADTRRRSSGPSLTDGCAVRPAQAVLRPPPTPFRHDVRFPVWPVIGPASPARIRSTPGRGGPLQFPPSLSERSAYAGEFLTAAIQVLHRVSGGRRRRAVASARSRWVSSCPGRWGDGNNEP